MKIAVLADIHANYPALLAVLDHLERWQPDRVIVAGDIVNRGPRPVEVLRLIRRKQNEEGWLILKGNHEDYVLFHDQPDAPHNGPLFEIYRYSHWTYRRLQDQIAYLRALPDEISEQTAGGEVRAVHASMRGNRSGIYPEMTDRLIARLIRPAPALMLVGHTHR
ncbi:MAG: metallophosphoesterase, partial [Anaerolineae bacterium]